MIKMETYDNVVYRESTLKASDSILDDLKIYNVDIDSISGIDFGIKTNIVRMIDLGREKDCAYVNLENSRSERILQIRIPLENARELLMSYSEPLIAILKDRNKDRKT